MERLIKEQALNDGMTTVLGSSRDLTKVTTRRDERGVWHYTFRVPCDRDGTTVSWAMGDDEKVGVKSAREIILNDRSWLAAKTAETAEHVLGAWQIYEHTGDVGFLKECYEDHFAKLFRKKLAGFAMNEFEVADVLEKMARLTENEEDVEQWQKLVRRNPEHVRMMFDQRWGMNGTANYFAAPDNGMIMTNGFWAMRSPYFPKEYAKPMVDAWALDREKGFFGEFSPLAMSKQSMKAFKTDVDHSFGYTPDTAYFTLDGMFRQGLGKVASGLTLNHLANYNYHDEWEIPVAPEAYRRDLSLFGDQYSNFNAGKILLFLEGLAGLEVPIPEKEFRVRPAMPEEWKWMEVRLPIAGKWTKVRYAKDGVKVSGCPLKVVAAE